MFAQMLGWVRTSYNDANKCIVNHRLFPDFAYAISLVVEPGGGQPPSTEYVMAVFP